MEKIVAIQLDTLKKRMEERKNELTWSEKALRLLAEEGYDPHFGARPLKRLIQHAVVNPLSRGILEGKIPPGTVVDLDVKDKEITYTTKMKKVAR